MSGRSLPSAPSVVTCCSKSQCSTIPAISTTRRSCISPQRPRVAGRAQRRHQVARLGLQLVLGLGERPDLLAEPGVGLLALELEEPQPLLVAAELLAQRGEQLLDGLGALVEIAARRLLGVAHAGVGQLQELGVVLLERLARQFGELAHELAPDLLGGASSLLGRAALVLERGLQGQHLGSRRAQCLGVALTLGADPGRGTGRGHGPADRSATPTTDDDADHESDDHGFSLLRGCTRPRRNAGV